MSRNAPKHWVLHDYLQVNGGAERLTITLAKALPDCALGVSGIYPEFTASGDLQGLAPELFSGVARVLPRIPRALITFGQGRPEIALAEVVVYSGIYAPLAVQSQRKGLRVMYCHTPPRFAFDQEESYLMRSTPAVRPFLKYAISLYRQKYLCALRAMDRVITNSQHVRRRLLKQTGIDATVVYPPIEIDRHKWLGQGEYYLSLGRLEPNKRVDRIIAAFKSTPDKKLIVASGGSQLQMLQELADGAHNISFTGWVDESTLAKLIGNAIACIYIPFDEDFGMSAVEALAAGKPVIGVDEGGLKESLIADKTGILLPSNPKPTDIIEAIYRIDRESALAMRSQCESEAEKFSKKRFLRAMQAQCLSLKHSND